MGCRHAWRRIVGGMLLLTACTAEQRTLTDDDLRGWRMLEFTVVQRFDPTG